VTAGADPAFAFPSRQTPGGPLLGDVIAQYLADAEDGRARESGGKRYTRESLRELRAALAHVDSQMGDRPVDELTSETVARLLGELARTGVATDRIDSVVLALHALHSYADVPDPAVPGGWVTRPAELPVDDGPSRSAAPKRTPTMEMLGAVQTVANWTVRGVVFLFALVALLVILEL
jgi:hypothetical protein